MSARNLARMFAQADRDDIAEGMLAYPRYHEVMRAIADKYGVPLPRVVAGFVSLSPNNDYIGNLRSLISVLNGIRDGVPCADITVATYKHCRDRAWLYLTGQKEFISETTGLKVLNFYHNVIDPTDPRYVTIDGHMVAAWRAKPLTMKEAILKRKRDYHEIAHAAKQLAFAQFMLPNQYQAIIWFTRKRVLGVRYDPQTDIFFQGDVWRTAQRIEDIRPYPPRTVEKPRSTFVKRTANEPTQVRWDALLLPDVRGRRSSTRVRRREAQPRVGRDGTRTSGEEAPGS